MINHYLCFRIEVPQQRIKMGIRCKSETIPVAVSFIYRPYMLPLTERLGRRALRNKSEDLPAIHSILFFVAFG